MRRVLLSMAVLAGAGAIYLYLNPDRWAAFREEVPGRLAASGHTTFYRWQDAAGDWQLSDRPPSADVPYTKVEVPRDANVLPSEAVAGRPAKPD